MMKNKSTRRKFIKSAAISSIGLTYGSTISSLYAENSNFEKGRAGIATLVSGSSKLQGGKYDWINHARIFIVDGYTYPLYPRIEYDAEKLAQTMEDMHANVLRLATSGFCDSLIPGTQFKAARDLGKRDLLAESITACKPRGIKVVPYLRTGGSLRTSSVKPEWAHIVNPAGETRSTWDLGAQSTAMCWNTPYREAFYDYVQILASKYDVDGFYFDSWFAFYGFNRDLCYCEGCKQGFKAFSGENLPYRERASQYTPDELKLIENYRDWYREELFKIFTETKRIIKSYQDIPLIYNINNPSRIMDRSANDVRIMNGSDAFLYERGKSMIERAEGVSLCAAHGINIWPYVGTYDPFPRIPHFKYELGQEIYTSVAFGGSPILYHSYFFVDHPESREIVKEAFQVVDKNEDSFSGFRSEKFCAVVWNDTDPPDHAINGYLWSVNARLSSLGSFSASIKNHIQTTSLLKHDLENFDLLGKYKVLYLPDLCYLTGNQIKNITAFVERGGGLVMTYATSLYDMNGNRTGGFALGDLAKIRYHKPDEKMRVKMLEHETFGSLWDMYLKTRPGQKVIRAPLSDGLIPAHVYETVEVLPGGEIIADLVSGSTGESITPGLIVSQFGKGKVAYISAAMGAMYLQTGIKEYSDFIGHVIQYVSPEAVPYEIDAPHSTLISNMTASGNRKVLHLINWTGSQSERMWQNVYCIPAVENVSVKFEIPDGKKVNGIKLLVPSEYSQKGEGNILQITLPRVEKYQGIIIDLG